MIKVQLGLTKGTRAASQKQITTIPFHDRYLKDVNFTEIQRAILETRLHLVVRE